MLSRNESANSACADAAAAINGPLLLAGRRMMDAIEALLDQRKVPEIEINPAINGCT
jgi:hypothetical protein